MSAKTEVTYVATLVNSKAVEFSLLSGNDTEKKAYLKHFLEVSRDQDLYFLDKDSGLLCNKNHIVTVREKV